VGQKSKPTYFCNNFVYCRPIYIIFGTYKIEEICKSESMPKELKYEYEYSTKPKMQKNGAMPY